MQIIVSGQHFDIGDSLRTYANEIVTKHIQKYFENAINAHVVFSKEGKEFHTAIIVNEGTGTHITIKSDAHDEDAYRSLEKAIKKMDKQLEKYKGRIKNHHKIKYSNLEVNAIDYTIAQDDSESEEHHDSNPTIIAEEEVSVKVMSVRDAVMHMELGDMNALLFVNSANSKLSFVHYRKDGNISWFDTDICMQEKLK